MKKAIGELSNTLIVVISVAILIAFFYYTVWPLLSNNFKSQTSCDKAVCNVQKDSTGAVITKNGKVECTIPGKTGTFWCNFKG